MAGVTTYAESKKRFCFNRVFFLLSAFPTVYRNRRTGSKTIFYFPPTKTEKKKKNADRFEAARGLMTRRGRRSREFIVRSPRPQRARTIRTINIIIIIIVDGNKFDDDYDNNNNNIVQQFWHDEF